ncbi:MAG: hypothetical protein ACFFDP_06650 [Promethearchaeota archaeon]
METCDIETIKEKIQKGSLKPSLHLKLRTFSLRFKIPVIIIWCIAFPILILIVILNGLSQKLIPTLLNNEALTLITLVGLPTSILEAWGLLRKAPIYRNPCAFFSKQLEDGDEHLKTFSKDLSIHDTQIKEKRVWTLAALYCYEQLTKPTVPK